VWTQRIINNENYQPGGQNEVTRGKAKTMTFMTTHEENGVDYIEPTALGTWCTDRGTLYSHASREELSLTDTEV
jgi:hypothetical protein